MGKTVNEIEGKNTTNMVLGNSKRKKNDETKIKKNNSSTTTNHMPVYGAINLLNLHIVKTKHTFITKRGPIVDKARIPVREFLVLQEILHAVYDIVPKIF